MGKIVAKFGGSSLSDAGQFRKVKKILEMDERRCYVVPSAPGRRFPEDEKVTDLLYRTYRLQSRGEDFHPAFSLIRERFEGIRRELGAKLLGHGLARALICLIQRMAEGGGVHIHPSLS